MINGINIFLEHIYDVCEQRTLTLEQALNAAREFGYSGLECDIWRLSEREEAKALFEKCGFHAESIYCHFDFAHESQENSIKAIHDCLETAAYFGAKKVLAIPGFAQNDEELSRVVNGLSIMCKAAFQRGITVTVEDFDDSRSPCSTTKGLLFLAGNVEGLGVTFDTGNFAYSLERAATAYDALSKYIKHVHLKDRLYAPLTAAEENAAKADILGRNMYPCAVGEGTVGAGEILKRLIADGYSGSVSAEHFGAASQLDCMEKSARFIIETAGLV